MTAALWTELEGPVEKVAPLLLGLRLKTEFPPGPTEGNIWSFGSYDPWADD